MAELVSYEVEGKIATISINRADKMNALNEDVIQGLRSAFRRYNDSNERCAILCAEGDAAFSVGADIKDPPREMWQGVPGVGVVTNKPIIACVQGYCIGGAYILVQMCDLVVAADNTIFKYPEAQVGFTGGLIAGCAARIPHKIAMEFMLADTKKCKQMSRAAEVYAHKNFSLEVMLDEMETLFYSFCKPAR